MITLKLKHWRTIGVAATALGLAACSEGGEGAEAGGEGGHGEAGPTPISESGGASPAPADEATATAESGEAAVAEGGGEHGEAGVITAYAGLSGDNLTALRIQHLRGFVMAAAKVIEDRGGGDPADAAVLVQQGLIEVYEPASDSFASVDLSSLREAAAGVDFTRAEMAQRLHAAQEELTRAIGQLRFDDAQLVARMVDISTGLYQNVLIDGVADPIEYQHSMGAALSARQAILLRRDEMRRQNPGAYDRAVDELDRLIALWPSRALPENPASYQQILAQGSRVRLALSPYL